MSLKKVIVPKTIRIWLKLGFQFPKGKDLVLELAGKHYRCSEHILWDAMGFSRGYAFLGKD